MKLPNGKQAIVPIEKLTEYTLSPVHPSGKHMARVFQAALGLTLDDSPFLQQTLQDIAVTHDAQPQTPNPYGERFVIDFKMTTNAGTATVHSAWIVRYGEDIPRLTSCYVIEDKPDESA